MAQWTTIDPNTLLPGDPWTSAKSQAAFENVEAVAEGAPGAPRVQGKALGGIRQAELSVTGTSWMEITGLADYVALDLICTITHNVIADLTVEVAFSTNNGSSWTSAQDLVRIGIDPAGTTRSFGVNAGLLDGLVIATGVSPTSLTVSNRLTFGAASYNAFRIRQKSTNNSNIILRAIPHYWENKS